MNRPRRDDSAEHDPETQRRNFEKDADAIRNGNHLGWLVWAADPPTLSDDELRRLDDVVSLAVRLRAHVNRDRYSREIESIHGAEGPGRMGLCLERLLAGLSSIGVPRQHALRIIEDVALASTPPIRRHAFELLTKTPTETRVIAKALRLPTTTARRALEELCAHGLAVRSRGRTKPAKRRKGARTCGTSIGNGRTGTPTGRVRLRTVMLINAAECKGISAVISISNSFPQNHGICRAHACAKAPRRGLV